MRMAHYFGLLSTLAALGLLATMVSGIWMSGEGHVAIGLFSAILTVAAHTLLIMFMIVTGRVLKAAMKSRPLGPEFLEQLNDFFAQRAAYPVAILAAFAVTVTAVLGYGRHIGVPTTVHMLVGLATVLLNLWAFQSEVRTLLENQLLLDRVTAELDRIDRTSPEEVTVPEEDWRWGPAVRWTIFAASAWGPYLYWGLVVWRGDFSRLGLVFPAGTALVSLAALLAAWGARRAAAQ